MSKEIDVKGKLVRFDDRRNVCLWENGDGKILFISPDDYRAMMKHRTNEK